jgi:hypothetical protein
MYLEFLQLQQFPLFQDFVANATIPMWLSGHLATVSGIHATTSFFYSYGWRIAFGVPGECIWSSCDNHSNLFQDLLANVTIPMWLSGHLATVSGAPATNSFVYS